MFPNFICVNSCGTKIFISIFTGRNEVVAKVIFLHLSVIHSVHRGGLPQCMLGYHHPPPPGSRPPWEQTPPHPRDQNPQDQTPLEQTPPPDQTPAPGSRLQHTVNERPVRILLECILVFNYFRAGSRDYEAERRFSGSTDMDRERDRSPRAFSAMGRRRRSSQDLHRKLTHIAQSFDRPRSIRYAKHKKHQTHKDIMWQLILKSCTQCGNAWLCMENVCYCF